MSWTVLGHGLVWAGLGWALPWYRLGLLGCGKGCAGLPSAVLWAGLSWSLKRAVLGDDGLC
jgi:hypothetical protein